MNNSLSTPEYATKVDLHIKSIKLDIEQSFLDLAEHLKLVRDLKLYEVLDYDRFETYIAQPELALDRSNVYKLIKVYEVFREKYKVAPAPLLKAGWDKLAKIAPHVTDDNYEYYLEKAETLSRSDLQKELAEHNLVTYKEQESQHVECPNCHYVFDPKKRAATSFKQEDYNKVINAYEQVKETKFKGKEYDPIMQSIKTMFMNGRTPQQIIATMDWLNESADYEWTIHTVKNKIAEILPKLEPQEEMTEFEKRWKSA